MASNLNDPTPGKDLTPAKDLTPVKNLTSIGDIMESKMQLDMKQVLSSKKAEVIRELKELDTILSRMQEEYSLKVEQLQSHKKPLEEALQHIEALLRLIPRQ